MVFLQKAFNACPGWATDSCIPNNLLWNIRKKKWDMDATILLLNFYLYNLINRANKLWHINQLTHEYSVENKSKNAKEKLTIVFLHP